MKLWVWDVTALCLVRVEGSGCILTGVGSLRVSFDWCRVTPGCFSLHIVHYFHYPFFRAYLHEYFFFLLSNVLTKLKYGPLY